MTPLSKFKIPDELSKAAGVRYVTDAEVRELLGIHGRCGQDLSGILFPYRDPRDGHPLGHRVRLDVPTTDGAKYLSEQGCRYLFFAPMNDGDLAKSSIPIVFVEAEKSALAIKALANRQGISLLAVATGGVWGWRRKNGSELQPDGTHQLASGPSPSLDFITWPGREAVIMFDSNVAGRRDLQKARHALARELAQRGARVFMADVPHEGGVNGPDDLIAITEDWVALQVFAKATPFVEEAHVRTENGEELADDGLGGAGSGRKESVATKLIEMASAESELFHSGDAGFAGLHIGGHLQTYALVSQGFRRWLSRRYFEEHQCASGREALTSAIQTLEGVALFQGPEQVVAVRIHGESDQIYLDLANDSWQVVAISAGGWRVIEASDCPVRFRRPRGMLALPVPQRGGNVRELQELLNVPGGNEFLLVTGWLIGTFHPTGPYPLLVLHGEQGSAKTTTARFLRALIDPNQAPLRSEPRNTHELMIAANNGLICVFDNLSGLAPWLSDALCRLSTGGGFSARALYTDGDEIIFMAKRPVILTGIDEIATRGDLLDRAIIVELPRIPENRYQTEREFSKRYEEVRPRVLGALLDGVVSALANHSRIILAHAPRMADIANWVTAAEPALGLQNGAFVGAYMANRSIANDLPLESPVADAVRCLELPWSGTATALLKILEALVDERTKHQRSWPSSPRSLSSTLKRLAPNLRAIGVSVDFTRDAGTGRRVITLKAVAPSSRSSQPTSQNPEPEPSEGLRHGERRDDCDARDDQTRTSSAPEPDSTRVKSRPDLEDEL